MEPHPKGARKIMDFLIVKDGKTIGNCFGNALSNPTTKSNSDDLYEKFKKVFSNWSSKSSYRLNVLEQLCGNVVEDSHTNILIQILKCTQNENEFLKSFLRMIGALEDFCSNEPLTIETQKTFSNKSRADGYIKWGNNIIIIENKVTGAPDGKMQIVNYVEGVKTEFQEAKIWVVYLTKDGHKEIDKCSYNNDKGKDIRESTNVTFSPLTYEKDIIPWLKEQVIPMVRRKDEELYASLFVYLKYLEAFTGQLLESKELDEDFQKEVNRNLNNTDNACAIYTTLTNVMDDLCNKRQNTSDTNDDIFIHNQFANAINRYQASFEEEFNKFTKNYFENEIDENSRENSRFKECHIHHPNVPYYIQIRDKRWPSWLHFEWVIEKQNKKTDSISKLFSDTDVKYEFVLHIETKDKEKFNKFLNKHKTDLKISVNTVGLFSKKMFEGNHLKLKDAYLSMAEIISELNKILGV